MKKENRFSGMLPGIVLVLTASFVLAVYAPLELWVTNQSEFWFDFKDLLTPVILVFSACSVGGIGLLFLLRMAGKRCYCAALTLGFAVLIGLYVQGNFLAGSLPPLDGTKVDWSAYPVQRALSWILWISVLAAAAALFFLVKEKGVLKAVLYGSLVVFLLLGTSLVTLFLTTKMEDKDGELLCTVEGEFELSTNQNLIVLMLDAANQTTFEEELALRPELREEFDGFTAFSDTLATYPFTSRAVPAILSGQWYENKGDFQEHSNRVLDESPLIRELENRNYSIGLYEMELLLNRDMFQGRIQNHFSNTSRFSSVPGSVKLLLKMAAIKYAPWDLKWHGYNAQTYSYNFWETEEASETFFWDNISFWEMIQENNPIELTQNDCFRFIHLEGAHSPMNMNRQVELEEGDYSEKVGASLTIAVQYLRRLKESGVYDNSAIVILADHGYQTDDGPSDYTKRGNPLLLIKGVGESHPMSRSTAPISGIDLAEAMARLLDGTPSEDIFEYRSGDSRERRFLWIRYGEEEHIEEMLVNGAASDPASYRKTGVVYDYRADSAD